MFKRISWFVSLLMAITMLAGCAQAPSATTVAATTAPTSAATAAQTSAATQAATAPSSGAPCVAAPAVTPRTNWKGVTYAIISPYLSLDYYVDYKRAIQVLEEEMPGVNVELLGPANYDIDATNTAMDQAITQGVNGILVMPWTAQQGPYIDKAEEAGIPVITVGVDLPTSKRLAYIGTSNYAAGQAAADWLANKIGGKGTMVIMYQPSLSNVAQREAGFKDELKANYPGVQVVAELDDQNDSNAAAQLLLGALQKNPNLSAVFAADGLSGPAAAEAVREAGLKKGQVAILGFDREDSLLAAIQDGSIAGSVIQGSFLEAYMGVHVLDMLNQGLASDSYNDKAAGVVLVPQNINPGVQIATQANVQYFRRNCAP